jgi:hypothetical protein
MEIEETVAGSHQLNKHVPAKMDMHATLEELLKVTFLWSILRLYNWTG